MAPLRLLLLHLTSLAACLTTFIAHAAAHATPRHLQASTTDWPTLHSLELYGNATGTSPSLDFASAQPHRVVGAGTVYSNQLIQDSLFMYEYHTNAAITVEYTALGSGLGKCRLLGYLDHCANPFVGLGAGGQVGNTDVARPIYLDFAVANEVAKPQDYASAPDLQYYPLAASAVVPVFNVPGLDTVVLSKPVLGRMFRGCDAVANPTTCQPGSITRWDDPDILALNPNSSHHLLAAAGKIKLVLRSDHVGLTFTLKSVLAKWDPGFAAQMQGHMTANGGPNEWPGVDVDHWAVWDTGLIGAVNSIPSSLGFASLPVLTSLPAPMASVTQDPTRGAAAVVSASPASVAQALYAQGLEFGNNGDDPAHLTADISDSTGHQAWPFALLSYLVVRKSTTRFGPDRCDIKNSTLDYATFLYSNDELDAHMARVGWAPLFSNAKTNVLSHIQADFACAPDASDPSSTAPVYVPPPSAHPD